MGDCMGRSVSLQGVCLIFHYSFLILHFSLFIIHSSFFISQDNTLYYIIKRNGKQ